MDEPPTDKTSAKALRKARRSGTDRHVFLMAMCVHLLGTDSIGFEQAVRWHEGLVACSKTGALDKRWETQGGRSRASGACQSGIDAALDSSAVSSRWAMSRLVARVLVLSQYE